MEFTNLSFLYLWLPPVLAAYFLARSIRVKNAILLGFSLVFYAMGQPLYLLMLVGLSGLNFYLSRKIHPGRQITVLVPVAVNIAVLVLFKYLDRTPNGVMPMGVSFYTFSAISYLVDIYRGRIPAEKRFSLLLLYLTMFPKILQGPIVRYTDIASQLRRRTTDPEAIFQGALRFSCGLAKKVLLADYCGKIIAELSGVGSDACFLGAWFTGLLFFFQIYFDFSGYSDMAIGLGRIFGFTYRENFDLPYMSRSLTEFWRRWHISLGSFFMDYVYIPLGGNRRGWTRHVLNLLAVWSLTGLWHGAHWNYLLWGLYFFAFLVAEKKHADRLKALPDLVRRAITIALVFFGWVLFAHEDPKELGTILLSMVGFHGFSAPGMGLKLLNSLPLIAVCTLACTSLPRWVLTYWYFICRMDKKEGTMTAAKIPHLVSGIAVIALLLWLCTVSLVGNTSAPSIYGGF